jgi:hypothetical protein
VKILLKSLCCLACGFLLIGAPAAAQAPPDAGRLLQEQRQPRTTLPDRLPEDKEKEYPSCNVPVMPGRTRGLSTFRVYG